jgi:hypothetical protein
MMDQFPICAQSLPVDPGHIRYLPCKNIKIYPEKCDEREFLFGVEVATNPELLVWVAGVNHNFIVFCPQGSHQLVVHLLIGG